MTVVPVKSIFMVILFWTAIDVIDFNFLHWLDLTAGQILDRAYWEVSVALMVWWAHGFKVPA